jgi:hypothetical protein
MITTPSPVRLVPVSVGLQAELIQKNRLGTFRYRAAKDKRPISPDEYTAEGFGNLLEALPLDRKGTCRGHTLLGVCGYDALDAKLSAIDKQSRQKRTEPAGADPVGAGLTELPRRDSNPRAGD